MDTEDRGALPGAVSKKDMRRARELVVASSVPSADVDDVAQEVLCALAFRRAPIEVREGFTPAQAREAFLCGVVERKVAQYWRQHVRDKLGPTLWAEVFPEGLAPSAEEQVIDLTPLLRIGRAIEELGSTEPLLYDVLVLSIEGIPATVAARRLNIPAGTASDRLRRARAMVRDLLRRRAAEEASWTARRVLAARGASPPMEALDRAGAPGGASMAPFTGPGATHPSTGGPALGTETVPSARR